MTSPKTLSTVPLVSIRVTAVIERELKRRGVFPELRLENAYRISNGATGVYLMGIEHAREVLEDAIEQRKKLDLPRGLLVAYGAFIKNIECVLKEEARRGFIEFPGMAEVQRQRVASSTCFSLGDRVLCFSPGDEYGHAAIIVGEYKMRTVGSDDGPYIDPDGYKFKCLPGYSVMLKGSKGEFFAAAHQLTRDDCKPSHIRLVGSHLADMKKQAEYG